MSARHLSPARAARVPNHRRRQFSPCFRKEAIMELNDLFTSERISFFAGGLMLLACWAVDYCTGGDDWQ